MKASKVFQLWEDANTILLGNTSNQERVPKNRVRQL